MNRPHPARPYSILLCVLGTLLFAVGCRGDLKDHDASAAPDVRADTRPAPDGPRDTSADSGPSPDISGCAGCLVGGTCHAPGVASPQDPCQVCAPSSSKVQWTRVTCVTTLAGTGTAGFADGAATTAAMLRTPEGVVVDALGKVYFSDSGNHCVRAVSGGQVATIAGTCGAKGFADGAASSARFNRPLGLALDGTGRIFVADYGNHRVRQLHKGQVSTLVGDGVAGCKDLPGGNARISSPADLAAGSGGLFLANRHGHDLRRISLSPSSVSLLAGCCGNHCPGCKDGPAASARFNRPSGIAADGSNRVYVADHFNHVIRLIHKGQVSTLAGACMSKGFADGAAVSARFDLPLGVAVDKAGKNVFVASYGANRIRAVRLVSGKWQVSTLAGTGQLGCKDGPAAGATFKRPRSLAADSSGKVYVADGECHKIRIITPAP